MTDTTTGRITKAAAEAATKFSMKPGAFGAALPGGHEQGLANYEATYGGSDADLGMLLGYRDAGDTDPVYATDIDYSAFDQEDLALLAIDLLSVGLYDNLDYMFDEDNQVRPLALAETVEDAIRAAALQEEIGTGTDFLDVLLRNYDGVPSEELAALIAEKKAASRSGGGGRVINYIDPVALIDAAKKGASAVTGRMATPEEAQQFVKTIHGLQATGATGINVGARAEAFAREQAPEEAKAMDYAGAAGLLMQALGVRR